MTKKINLTQGKFALVDDDDYEKLNKHKWHAVKKGRVFYVARKTTNDGTVYMHRYLLGLKSGDDKFGDHIDRNPLNNRMSNLRVVDVVGNLRNHSGRSHNTSGSNGVDYYKAYNKWRARIGVNGVSIHLGYFDKTEGAIKARKLAEQKYWQQQ